MREKIEIVKELISIAEDNELAEISVDFKGLKVEIKKEVYVPVSGVVTSGMQVGGAQGMSALQSSGDSAVPQATSKKETPPSGVAVKTPLSGVFYRAPKPGAPPFVNVGDMVEQGQTLCIIEAMKLMNEIASDIKGKVLQICVENAQVANEGEVLFYLEPVS